MTAIGHDQKACRELLAWNHQVLVRRFLFVMKFAETEERIPERVRNHVPLIIKTLTDLSAMGSRPQVAFTAKDGSVVGIAFKSEERPAQIMREIRGT